MSDDKDEENKDKRGPNELIQTFAGVMNYTTKLLRDYESGKIQTEEMLAAVRALSVVNKSGSNIIRMVQLGPDLLRAIEGITFEKIQSPAIEMISCPLHESQISRQNCLDIAESHKHEECAKCPEKKVTETLLLG